MKEQLKMDKKIAASQREDRTPQKLLIYIVINDSIENDKLVQFTLTNSNFTSTLYNFKFTALTSPPLT